MKMFCLTLEPSHYQFIKDLNYIPVGLGDKTFDNNWLSDKSGENISEKNKYYGEYTFHYWIWKNYLDKLDNEWIGFCQYRKFWCLNEYKNEDINFSSLSDKVLKQIPKDFDSYDSIVGKPMYINQLKLMKFFKKGLTTILKKPSLLFNEKKRNLNFHFDLMHGANNLNKAIDLLDAVNKDAFRKFVNTEVSFNPHNMFICKSKNKLKDYYNVLFPWLEKCEELFGFENLKGYDKTRIYGFLAERFMSYWFNKYTRCTTMPIIFYDIRIDLNR
tara:strand:- start:1965 stop:2780 length:816 start_codon:yes stop_codon:yes gene_type:complete